MRRSAHHAEMVDYFNAYCVRGREWHCETVDKSQTNPYGAL
jgi:hypothetical protein